MHGLDSLCGGADGSGRDRQRAKRPTASTISFFIFSPLVSYASEVRWCKTILQLDNVRVAPVELTARIVTLRLAETFVISRESSDEDDVVQVELRHDGVTGFGGGADRATRVGPSLAYLEARRRSRRRPVRARGDRGAPPGENAARAALDGALHDLQGSCSACPSGAARAAADRPADLLDGVARRPGRHGAARREGGAALRRLKLKLGGPTVSTSSASAPSAPSPTCRSWST